MRPLSGLCRLGLGGLHRRPETPDIAREHLAAAAAIFAELEMPYRAERAAAETAALTGSGRRRRR